MYLNNRCPSVWAAPCPPPRSSWDALPLAFGRAVGWASTPFPFRSRCPLVWAGPDALPLDRRGHGIESMPSLLVVVGWASMPSVVRGQMPLVWAGPIPPRSSWHRLLVRRGHRDTPSVVRHRCPQGGPPPSVVVGLVVWACGHRCPLGRRGVGILGRRGHRPPPRSSRPWASMPSVVFGPRSGAGGARRPPFLGFSSPCPFAPWLPRLSIVSGSLVVVGCEAHFFALSPNTNFRISH